MTTRESSSNYNLLISLLAEMVISYIDKQDSLDKSEYKPNIKRESEE